MTGEPTADDLARARRRRHIREELIRADAAIRRALEAWPPDHLGWQDLDEARLQLRVARDRIERER